MIVAFVHLGKNPSPTLNSMARAAAFHEPSAKVLLITDLPQLHQQFPGSLIKYDRRLHNRWFKKVISRRREITKIAGGYWSHTLERLFALNVLIPTLGNQTLIHLESDVYLNMSSEIAKSITQNLDRIAVPRFSSDLGIASIFVAKNSEVLERSLSELKEILISDSLIDSDMKLLGKALNDGTIAELPTHPSKPLKLAPNGKMISEYIFDGAFLGQYLFGQDPFHTDGRRISGYVNPSAQFDPTKLKYSIKQSLQNSRSAIFIDDIEILNLHIHSKIELLPVDSTNERWMQAIKEGNHEVGRITDDFTPNIIHTQPIGLINRLRIAKRKGLTRSITNAIIKRILPK